MTLSTYSKCWDTQNIHRKLTLQLSIWALSDGSPGKGYSLWRCLDWVYNPRWKPVCPKCIVITIKFIRYRLCIYSFLLCRSTREIVNDKFYVNIFSLICFLFQEPAYCKLSYFEILKICDFVNSLKKNTQKKTHTQKKNTQKKKNTKKKITKKKKKRRGKKKKKKRKEWV